MKINEFVAARFALVFGISSCVLACTDDVGQDGEAEAEDTDGTQDDADTDTSGDGDGDGEGNGDGDGEGNGDGDGDGDVEGDGDGDVEGDGDGDFGGDGDGDGEGEGNGDSDVSPEDIAQACADSCERFSTCTLEFPGCEDLCIAGYEDLTGECLDTMLALSQCSAMLTCEEFALYLEAGPDDPCAAEREASWNCTP